MQLSHQPDADCPPSQPKASTPPLQLAGSPSQSKEKKPTDGDLVVAARAGEMWARQALFQRYVAMVSGLSFRLLGADQDLDDVVQDVFLQALRSLKSLREPEAFGSWLGSITVRSVRKTIAHRRMLERFGLRRPALLEEESLAAVQASPEVVIELRAIYESLSRAGADVRLIYLLRRMEGCTVREIAEHMKTSTSTVKRRIADGEKAVANWRASRGLPPCSPLPASKEESA